MSIISKNLIMVSTIWERIIIMRSIKFHLMPLVSTLLKAMTLTSLPSRHNNEKKINPIRNDIISYLHRGVIVIIKWKRIHLLSDVLIKIEPLEGVSKIGL